MSCHVTLLQSLALHKFLQRAHSHRVVLRPFTWGWFSLVPRPSLKSGKRIWCSERHFFSHGAGPYFIKNVKIVLLNLELKFLMSQSVWTTTQPGLQKAQDGRKVYWDSRKQAARQVFTVSDSFQNTIAYVMQL